MGEKIVVYTLAGEQWVVDRNDCVLLDRTLTKIRKECEWKAKDMFTGGPTGTGVMMARANEFQALGSATHEGMRILLTGGSEKDACAAAWNYMLNAAVTGLTLQDDEALWELLPDVALTLVKEQAALAYMLVAAFARRKLAPFLAEYKVLGAELEINWLLGHMDGKYYVVMSRPDAVVQRYADGLLFPVSFKTTKRFEASTVTALRSDAQQWTEGLAVQAAFGGNPPGGCLYFHCVKGDTSKDKELGYKRQTNRAVRPWIPKKIVGQPFPSDFAMEWDFYNDETMKTSSLSSQTWRRFDVWDELNGGLTQWVEWLDQGIIDTRHNTDWLEGMIKATTIKWKEWPAERWVLGQREIEKRWQKQLTVWRKAQEALSPKAAQEMEASIFERNESACQSFKKPCIFYNQCWGDEQGQFTTIQDDLDKGRLTARIENHDQERKEVDFDD